MTGERIGFDVVIRCGCHEWRFARPRSLSFKNSRVLVSFEVRFERYVPARSATRHSPFQPECPEALGEKARDDVNETATRARHPMDAKGDCAC
jgi:hypothetical protein